MNRLTFENIQKVTKLPQQQRESQVSTLLKDISVLNQYQLHTFELMFLAYSQKNEIKRVIDQAIKKRKDLLSPPLSTTTVQLERVKELQKQIRFYKWGKINIFLVLFILLSTTLCGIGSNLQQNSNITPTVTPPTSFSNLILLKENNQKLQNGIQREKQQLIVGHLKTQSNINYSIQKKLSSVGTTNIIIRGLISIIILIIMLILLGCCCKSNPKSFYARISFQQNSLRYQLAQLKNLIRANQLV